MKQYIIFIFLILHSCSNKNSLNYDLTLKCSTKNISEFNFKENDSIVLKHNLFILLNDIDSINNEILKTKYSNVFKAGYRVSPLKYFKYFEDNYREIEVGYFLESKTNSNDVYLLDSSMRNIIYGVKIDLLKIKVTDLYVVGYKRKFVLENERLTDAYNRICIKY
jgi:hypothetical protein